uniref:Uncharacterized protein n=1 Tax=Oryza brachyantha TaxID=4533 RepID=J3N7A2_ORYBR
PENTNSINPGGGRRAVSRSVVKGAGSGRRAIGNVLRAAAHGASAGKGAGGGRPRASLRPKTVRRVAAELAATVVSRFWSN